MEFRLITNIDGDYDKVAKIIASYMSNEPGIKEIFGSKVTRLASSDISALIQVDGEYVGFVNMLTECTKNMLFVDIGILEQYRGNGYCKETLELIKNLRFQEYIISEIKSSNIAANKSALATGCLVYQYEDRNFYLLQRELKDEFLASADYELIKNHCENYGNRALKKGNFDDCY